jgi:hypothetical protein
MRPVFGYRAARWRRTFVRFAQVREQKRRVPLRDTSTTAHMQSSAAQICSRSTP